MSGTMMTRKRSFWSASPNSDVNDHRCSAIRGGRRESGGSDMRATTCWKAANMLVQLHRSHNTSPLVHTLCSCIHRSARPSMSIPWPTPRAAQSKSNILPIMYAPASPPTAAP